MESSNHPHGRYRHVYVVVRLFREADAPTATIADHDVYLTKAYPDEADALAEAARLAKLSNRAEHYFVSVVRLVS